MGTLQAVCYTIIVLSCFLDAGLAVRSDDGMLKHASSDASDKQLHIRRDEFKALDHAAVARWLLHKAEYGVAATASSRNPGWPFSAVLSVSDGPDINPTGRIIFFAAGISDFAADIAVDNRTAFTVTEEQVSGECLGMDPEWPLCARVTFVGSVAEVPPADKVVAEELLFARHPQMRFWPQYTRGHNWMILELHLAHAEVLDFFGGYHHVPRDAYFAATPKAPTRLGL